MKSYIFMKSTLLIKIINFSGGASKIRKKRSGNKLIFLKEYNLMKFAIIILNIEMGNHL